MSDAEAIPVEPKEDPALDYEALRVEGTAVVQRLSGDIWTDYNEHDPGVTTLEQVCYALTELAYRALLPMEDLLARGTNGEIAGARQALFAPASMLPCSPVTLNDWRKLLMDRDKDIGNVWLVPCRARQGGVVEGLYDILVQLRSDDPCPPGDEGRGPEGIDRRVWRLFARHRFLCEDVHRVRVLTVVPAVVSARVDLAEHETPESVLADIFFRLGMLFAPEPRRHRLSDLMALGLAPDAIFNGPLPRDGFILDDELGPKPSRIGVPEVLKTIARCAGVTGVRNLAVRVDGGKPLKGNDVIAIKERDTLRVETRADFRGGFTITLYRGGRRCTPDAATVRTALDRLWTRQRRVYPLVDQYSTLFAMPRGRHYDLGRYISIQEQYPVVYGIGGAGLPADASAERRAQARQLKGYLLVFDQMMADFFAQLAHAKDLFTIDPVLPHTYFWGSLWDAVPGIGALVSDQAAYEKRMDRLTAASDPVVARRNLFLDELLALYAERVTPAQAPAACGGTADATEPEVLLRTKLHLLHRLPVATRDRGRAFDYLSPPSPRNIAGMEIKVRIELGMRADTTSRHDRLYLLEHVLLRFGRPDAGTTFPFAFTLTAILSADGRDAGYARNAAEVVRRNAPAHVATNCIFLGPAGMARFEELYDGWRRALLRRDPREVVRTSTELIHFLQPRLDATSADQDGV